MNFLSFGTVSSKVPASSSIEVLLFSGYRSQTKSLAQKIIRDYKLDGFNPLMHERSDLIFSLLNLRVCNFELSVVSHNVRAIQIKSESGHWRSIWPHLQVDSLRIDRILTALFF